MKKPRYACLRTVPLNNDKPCVVCNKDLKALSDTYWFVAYRATNSAQSAYVHKQCIRKAIISTNLKSPSQRKPVCLICGKNAADSLVRCDNASNFPFYFHQACVAKMPSEAHSEEENIQTLKNAEAKKRRDKARILREAQERRQSRCQWNRVFNTAPRFKLIAVDEDSILATYGGVFGESGIGHGQVRLRAEETTYHRQRTIGVRSDTWEHDYVWRELSKKDRLKFCRMLFGEPTLDLITHESKFVRNLSKWFAKNGGDNGKDNDKG